MNWRWNFLEKLRFDYEGELLNKRGRGSFYEDVCVEYLIKNGYMMMQFSVYCKIFANREAAVKHVNILRKNVPKEGQIRILIVTEKQYAKIEIIVGGKSLQEATVNAESFIEL